MDEIIKSVIEPIDFDLLDDQIQIKYLDAIFKLYPYNLYKSKQQLLQNIIDKKIVVWAIIRDSELKGLMLTYISSDIVLNGSVIMDPHSMIEEDLEEMDAVVTEHAKKNNCKIIEISGRRGWEKLIKKYGYEFSMTLMHKVI